MSWQRELKSSYKSPKQILARLNLPDDTPIAKTSFVLQATDSYLDRIEKANPLDPLFRQIWADPEEQRRVRGFETDCVGEHEQARNSSIIKKYKNRSLVVSTAACAIHCRYCFRREFPYEGKQNETIARELQAHLNTNETEEVIFSGGDPLVLETAKLSRLIEPALNSERVKTIRFHTRVPVVLPSRIGEEFCDFLSKLASKTLVIVVHINHANEIDENVVAALAKLRAKNVLLLNQSVLLRGVNDSVFVLKELSYKLIASGVLPYYLHLLDRVQGTQHFDLSDERGRELVLALRRQLPGYLVPRLARELAGEASKVVLC